MLRQHRRHGAAVLMVLTGLVHSSTCCGSGRGAVRRLPQRRLRVARRPSGRVLLGRRHAGTSSARPRPSPRGGRAGGVIALTAYGPYPVSMVGLPGEPVSNMSPPTFALACQAAFVIGVALLLRGPLGRWLQRPRPWAVVVTANGWAMTAFLWHLTALFASWQSRLRSGCRSRPWATGSGGQLGRSSSGCSHWSPRVWWRSSVRRTSRDRPGSARRRRPPWRSCAMRSRQGSGTQRGRNPRPVHGRLRRCAFRADGDARGAPGVGGVQPGLDCCRLGARPQPADWGTDCHCRYRAGVPPVMRTSSSNVVANTAWGAGGAHHGYFRQVDVDDRAQRVG